MKKRRSPALGRFRRLGARRPSVADVGRRKYFISPEGMQHVQRGEGTPSVLATMRLVIHGESQPTEFFDMLQGTLTREQARGLASDELVAALRDLSELRGIDQCDRALAGDADARVSCGYSLAEILAHLYFGPDPDGD